MAGGLQQLQCPPLLNVQCSLLIALILREAKQSFWGSSVRECLQSVLGQESSDIPQGALPSPLAFSLVTSQSKVGLSPLPLSAQEQRGAHEEHVLFHAKKQVHDETSGSQGCSISGRAQMVLLTVNVTFY